ncbi:unnamed protein product [Adineta ricciae]|uniref:Uncharacterized protein n=1 Tax=Adineta ricciae TaxID=249248 RepID=A0A815TDS6_ADIRI|nr:unnamed protein product [Adineta ricciae]CAF1503807.1 unnamed protein product [Adineta ricciae]
MSQNVRINLSEVVNEQIKTNPIKRTVSDEIQAQPKTKLMNHTPTAQQIPSFCSASAYMKKITNAEDVTVKETVPIPDITDEELLMMAQIFENTNKNQFVITLEK